MLRPSILNRKGAGVGAFAVLLALICFSSIARANELEKGKILVASKAMGDPRFAQTVILLIRYDRQGTLGLIVNVPTKIPAAKAFPGVTRFYDSDLLFIGGPVDRRQYFLLIQSGIGLDDASRVIEDIYVSADPEAIEKIVKNRKEKDRARLYVGYAGWAPDQLELEIAAGGWHVLPADVSVIFHSKPAELWPEMIRRASLIRTSFPESAFGAVAQSPRASISD